MTLTLNLDLDMVKMYLYTKNEVLCEGMDGQTDGHDWKDYLPAYAGGNYRQGGHGFMHLPWPGRHPPPPPPS